MLCLCNLTMRACPTRIEMCVESTGNGIGTGETGDTGDEVSEEPADEETRENGDSQDRLNIEIIALEMREFDDEEGIESDSEEDN